jgi:hypothetical protein
VWYLEEKEYIRWQPFDAAFDTNAKLEDLDEDKMHDFILQARAKRNFPLEYWWQGKYPSRFENIK